MHNLRVIKAIRIFARSVVAMISAVFALNGMAAAPQGVTLSKPWLRFVLASNPASGYFTLANTSNQAHLLDGVTSSACGELMMHRSVREGGIERMTMEDSVEIPAHGSLSFEPGSYHLMCVAPTASVRPGKTVAITLHFSDGSEIIADFPVRSVKDE